MSFFVVSNDPWPYHLGGGQGGRYGYGHHGSHGSQGHQGTGHCGTAVGVGLK